MRHLTALMIFLLIGSLFANNIQMTSPALTGQNTASHTTLVQFNLSWENSWRDIVNWDAAWIFVKYKRNDGVWRHATLALSGHTAPTGSTITTSFDGKGVFIYRSSEGSGTNNFPGVQLKWNYGSDEVGDNDLVTVKVFAIEMVYVPEGSFYAGDGSGTGNSLCASDGISPFLITTDGGMTMGGSDPANLHSTCTSDDFNAGTTRTLPVTYPTGYNAFFCMKYEVSQGQYCDFLNTLTTGQAANRFYNTVGNRNTIASSGSSYIVSRPDRAYGFFNTADFCAYADWSALRPMSGLEYEKACRGDQYPVPGEYAWGTTYIEPAAAINGVENGTETISTTGANCNINAITFSGGDGGVGGLRCGIFATPTSNREEAGASYYGILDLTGNMFEKCVDLGWAECRQLSTENGDGMLDVNGNADAAGTVWINISDAGGSWRYELSNPVNLLKAKVSGRRYSTSTRVGDCGARYVRSSPNLSADRPEVQHSKSAETKQ